VKKGASYNSPVPPRKRRGKNRDSPSKKTAGRHDFMRFLMGVVGAARAQPWRFGFLRSFDLFGNWDKAGHPIILLSSEK